MSICQAFHISPFQIRRERFSEFCLLIKRLQTYEPEKNAPKVEKKGGKAKTYIPVKDYKPPEKEVGVNGRKY